MIAGSSSNSPSVLGTRPPTAVPPRSQSTTTRRAAILLIAVAWCGALTWLVLTASNPVTLNRRQILEADAVVTVTVEDLGSGRCRVVKRWAGEALPDVIVVDGLSQTAAQSHGEWILPLANSGEERQIVASRLPSRARLVYPATPETIAQLKAILKP